MNRLLLAVLTGLCLAHAAQAEDLALRIDHEIVSLGADGVTRISRFSERLTRRDSQSWNARILPPGAHEEADHQAGGKEHKHMDVAAAARWVTRGDDGKLRVRLVNQHERVIVDVAPVDYANIGFDGQWATASTLVDPQQIKRMKPVARQAPAGSRWFEGGGREMKIQILWDDNAHYPRRIESTNSSGTQRASLTATREPMPPTLPWTQLTGYTQKEYSDLLD